MKKSRRVAMRAAMVWLSFLLALSLCSCQNDTSDANPSESTLPDNTLPTLEEVKGAFYTANEGAAFYDYFAELLPKETELSVLQAQYPGLNIAEYDDYAHVAHNPNGTADEPPYGTRQNVWKDSTAEGITCRVASEVIPLAFESFDIIFEHTDADGFIDCVRTPRIEKYEDGAWQRLWYRQRDRMPYDARLAEDEAGNARVIFATGFGQATVTIDREGWISPIVPGKYRVLVYIGYEATPMYAEFEIVD